MCVCTAADLTYILKIVLLRSVIFYIIRNLFSARLLKTQLFSLTSTKLVKCFSSFGKLRYSSRCPVLDL